jgi:hypothetical protein
MNLKLKLLETTSAVVLTFSLPIVAQAASVTTVGTWSNITGNPTSLTGVGTSQISWGTPASGIGKSSYIFKGVTAKPISLPSPGGISNIFDLGTFTHNNFPIFNNSITGATLNINANIEGNLQTFSFDFSHLETPNNANPCAAGGVQPCPDLVSFLNNGVSSETINIAGEEYNLVLSGFLSSGVLVDEFLTLEGLANTAILQGKLVSNDIITNPVPEPLTILGASSALGFGAFFKRKLAKHKQKKA